jgi:hypothetical protein
MERRGCNPVEKVSDEGSGLASFLPPTVPPPLRTKVSRAPEFDVLPSLPPRSSTVQYLLYLHIEYLSESGEFGAISTYNNEVYVSLAENTEPTRPRDKLERRGTKQGNLDRS